MLDEWEVQLCTLILSPSLSTTQDVGDQMENEAEYFAFVSPTHFLMADKHHLE